MGTLLSRAVVPLAILLCSTAALAQGVVDQQNDPSGGNGFGCGSPPILNGSIHQSFVPTADNLVAVELRLAAGSSFPSGGTTVTAQIRAGSSSGTVLGVATASVAGPLAQTTQVLVRFDFTQITLVPGSTYLIEWITPVTTTLTWVGQGGDLYPAGTAFSCSGNPWPVAGTDFNFVTYKADPPPPEPPAEEPPAEEPPAEEPPAQEPPVEETPEPPTCEELLGQLRELVAGLELHKFKQCALDRLLEGAQKQMARGKPKSARALVIAAELQIRVLARIGLISAEEADTILNLAEEFRTCLGVETKIDWRNWWHYRHDHDDHHHHHH
ncbi:MAG: hypothetical protein ACHQ1G_07205 [Planctomycetota bacterium]